MTFLDEILQQFPVRKSAAEKEAFRQYFIGKAKSMGYRARVEQNGRFVKHNNVIVGDPEHAAAVFTAHYDTPARHLLPSLIIPRNVPVFYAWQLLNVLLLLVVAVLATAVIGAVIRTPGAILWIFVAVYFGLLMLLNYGPANKRNANNSSGLAALMETMAAIPQEQRDKVAFILFDDSKKGKQGSNCYGKTHLQVQCVKTIIHLDCVGVGEELLVFSKKMARMRPEYARFCKAMREDEGRAVHILEGGLTSYTSDHDSFQCGVAVLACQKSAGLGWCVPNLNTPKDTACDPENIAFLAKRLAAFAETL